MTSKEVKNVNYRLIFAIAATAIGSAFQHGYNTGVVNAPQTLLEQWITDVLEERCSVVDHSEVTMIFSLIVSMFCVGGIIGGCLTGVVANSLGRRGGLIANNVLVVLSAVLMGSAKYASSYEMVIAGRFLIGINSGLNAGLAPMYLAEISPVRLRGATGTVYQLVITISILLSQIFGLSSNLGTEDHWPILLAITVVPAFFQLVTLPFCPESPKHLLVTMGREIAAKRALKWFRGTTAVDDEMNEMRREYEDQNLMPKVTLRKMFFSESLRAPLFISVIVMIGQQLSGINAVVFFSTKIFKMAEMSDSGAQYATLAMGIVNVGMTVVSLVLVEKAGRKTLLLVGFIGMFLVTVSLVVCLEGLKATVAVSYTSVVLVLAFVVMFAVGPGSIPWFLVAELFSQSARPAATAIAVAVNWIANFIVGLGFLPLQELMGGFVFVIFALLLLFFSLFVYFKVPETKNRTVEEISAMFRRRSNGSDLGADEAYAGEMS